MPASRAQFTFDADELLAAQNRAAVERSGGATPVFDGQEDLPRVWDINDLAMRPQATWLIDNVVEDRGLTVFFGPDKVGKTAALSNFLWAWCAGKEEFLSFEMEDPPEAEGRRVLYVLLEGQANFYSRYDAWLHAYNGGEPLEGFYVMDEGLSLFQSRMEWEDPNTWTPSSRKLWNAVDALRPHVLVIDTLSRATAGMDENSSSMAHVVGMMDHMRDVYGLSTVIVHHTSLADGDRPRGHSSLKGAASSYVRIEGKPEQEVLTLVTGPHRNSDVFKRIPFKRRAERSSFVIEAAAHRKTKSKRDELFEIVREQPRANLSDYVRWVYGTFTPATQKSLLDLVRNHPNLEYRDGKVVVLEAADVEDI